VSSFLETELAEQPEALARFVEHQRPYAEEIAELFRAHDVQYILIASRGSSSNAARYAQYLLGRAHRVPVSFATPSLYTLYGQPPRLDGALVIGISQSGESPDVRAVIEEARRQGRPTVAITNKADSPLGRASNAVLQLDAGDERAVAATKTYLTQVAALGLLAAHVAGDGARFASDLRRVADQLRELIPALEQRLATVAPAFAFVGRMFVIGRGIEFGTAREIALKLLETSRIGAEALTATDLAHGPVAALDPLFPVWTIASHDETLPAVVEAAGRIKAAGGMLIASGSAADLLHEADYRLEVPTPPQPLLSPLLSAIPGQVFAAAIARAKGLDPDRPAQLSKVTLAR
jgi:glutamine---fructose-6-phosphate transaminase (isomerizing)